MLHLTFDDGPDPRGTPAVLDALAAAGATATFFVLGECAAALPALVERTLEAGHAVEVHGHGHLRHPLTSRECVEGDLDAALAVLDGLGIAPRLWRVPWGDLAPWTAEVAAERGLTLAGWTADTHDWRGDDAATMLAALEPAAERRRDRARPRRHRAGRRARRREGDRAPDRPARGGRPRPRPRAAAAATRRAAARRQPRARAGGMTAVAPTPDVSPATLDGDRGAARRRSTATPRFPHAAFEALAADGALALTAGEQPVTRAREWAAVRAVARADGSVGRLYEGHLNGVERIAVAAPEPLRSAELDAVRARQAAPRRVGCRPRARRGRAGVAEATAPTG